MTYSNTDITTGEVLWIHFGEKMCQNTQVCTASVTCFNSYICFHNQRFEASGISKAQTLFRSTVILEPCLQPATGMQNCHCVCVWGGGGLP